MFAAISGLKVHQIMLDVTANDLANVNTIGFKAGRISFKESLSQLQRGGAGPTANQGGANAVQVGLGVQLGSIDNQMQSGSLQSTGALLDVAIQGEGWFRVATGTPTTTGPFASTNTEFTRAGNFTRNKDGWLITQDGYYVVGRNAVAGAGGAPASGGTEITIQIPAGATNVAIAQDGSVSYDLNPPAVPPGGAVPVPGSPNRFTVGYLSLAKFANESGLERTSANRWSDSNASGAAQVGVPGGDYGLTTAGTLEMSNVELASEFTQMITAQRGFQANSRVIGTADDMLQELVNLKR